MSTAAAILDTVQAQVLEAVKQGQELVVDAVRTAAEAVEPLLPDLSTLPFADQFANPAELVDSSFEFAEKLIARQHDFVKRILVAVNLADVVPPAPAPAPAPTAAPKPAAKAPAAKPAAKTARPGGSGPLAS